jgi:hypothetical protein
MPDPHLDFDPSRIDRRTFRGFALNGIQRVNADVESNAMRNQTVD